MEQTLCQTAFLVAFENVENLTFPEIVGVQKNMKNDFGVLTKIIKTKIIDRQTGFDCLKIICMLWIILRHLAAYTGALNISNLDLNANYIFTIFFFVGGDIANCVFILISGYLMYDKKLNIQRWSALIIDVLFYSIMGYGILALFGYEDNVAYIVKRMLFPFHMNTYWFISSYVILYIFFPVFNLVIRPLINDF